MCLLIIEFKKMSIAARWVAHSSGVSDRCFAFAPVSSGSLGFFLLSKKLSVSEVFQTGSSQIPALVPWFKQVYFYHVFQVIGKSLDWQLQCKTIAIKKKSMGGKKQFLSLTQFYTYFFFFCFQITAFLDPRK